MSHRKGGDAVRVALQRTLKAGAHWYCYLSFLALHTNAAAFSVNN